MVSTASVCSESEISNIFLGAVSAGLEPLAHHGIEISARAWNTVAGVVDMIITSLSSVSCPQRYD